LPLQKNLGGSGGGNKPLFIAALKLMFFGDEINFTFGTGPDHSIFDLYIGQTLYQSYDGYAASSGEQTITVNLDGQGPHLFEIRNRHERNLSSSGYKVRFKQLVVVDSEYDLHTVEYQYDAISRLLSADYYPGLNVNAAPFREHAYGYDLAGNLVDMDGVTRTFNAANQLVDDGTDTLTYDDKGNLTNDGVNAYTWDRANRLLSMGGVSYAYDGLSNRISRDNGVDVTKYLLDLQPGLSVVLSATEDSDVTRYVHSPRGIHAQEDNAGVWTHPLQDGLGNVRSVVDNALSVLWTGNPAPYGEYFSETGTRQSPYLFTGEYTDPITGLVHLRARDYHPALGVFASLDPFEGIADRPMSLNGYMYVEGDVPNLTDSSGDCPENPWWNDIPGQRCKWLANELHRQYNIPLPNLMKRNVVELEYAYAVGNLNNTLTNASIIPNLFYENPQAALQAVQQYVSGCNKVVHPR
jgi:RHS repeat-associated protein